MSDGVSRGTSVVSARVLGVTEAGRVAAWTGAGASAFGPSRHRMNTPMTTRKTANPRLSCACGTRWLSALPTNDPTIPMAAKRPMSCQSTACPAPASTSVYFQNPAALLAAMMSRLVPTASRIDSPPRSTSAGTIRNPPPTPTRPVSTPTASPSAAISHSG